MKLLTEFDGHPAILRVGLAGAGLYARSLAYAGRYETDGDIPESWVTQTLASDKHLLKQAMSIEGALVEHGLWQKTDFGYRIVDFTKHNHSHRKMEELRKNRSRAGKKGVKAKQAKAKASADANAQQSNSYSSSTSNSSSFSSSNGASEEHPADLDVAWLKDEAHRFRAEEAGAS